MHLDVIVFAKGSSKRAGRSKEKAPDKELTALATDIEVKVLPSRQCTALTLEGPSAATSDDAAQRDDHAMGEHVGMTCDRSGVCPILGNRFHLRGEDYDLCQAEYETLDDEEKARYECIPPPAQGSKAGVPRLVTVSSKKRSGSSADRFELVAYAGSAVDSLTFRASSLAGDLDASEVKVELTCESHPEIFRQPSAVKVDPAYTLWLSQGDSSAPAPAESDARAKGNKLPPLYMPRVFEANRPIVISIEDKESGVKVLLQIKLVADVRKIDLCCWSLGPNQAKIPVDQKWASVLTPTLLDPHGNKVEPPTLTELGLHVPDDVRLHVREDTTTSGVEVRLGDAVSALASQVKRTVQVLATSTATAAGTPQPSAGVDDEWLPVQLVQGSAKRLVLVPEKLTVKNCELLPNIELGLTDEWGNACTTPQFTASVEPSAGLAGALAVPMQPVSGRSVDGKLVVPLSDQFLRVRQMGGGDPIEGSLAIEVTATGLPVKETSRAVAISITAGSHPVEIVLSGPPPGTVTPEGALTYTTPGDGSPLHLTHVVGNALTLPDLYASAHLENGAEIDAASAAMLAPQLCVRYYEEHDAGMLDDGTCPPSTCLVKGGTLASESSSVIKFDAAIWPHPSKAGEYNISVEAIDKLSLGAFDPESAVACRKEHPPIAPLTFTLTLNAGVATQTHLAHGDEALRLLENVEVDKDVLLPGGFQVVCKDAYGNSCNLQPNAQIEVIVVSISSAGSSAAVGSPAVPRLDPNVSSTSPHLPELRLRSAEGASTGKYQLVVRVAGVDNPFTCATPH